MNNDDITTPPMGCTQCPAWFQAGWLRGAEDGNRTGREQLAAEQLAAQASAAEANPFPAEGKIKSLRAKKAREHRGWRA